MLGLFAQFSGQVLHALSNPGRVRAMHHDTPLPSIPECDAEWLPPRLVGFVGPEPSVPRRLKFEVTEVGVNGECAGDERDTEDEPGPARAKARDPADQTGNDSGLFVAFRAHRVRSPPCRDARGGF